jgi:hypothetical protein
MSTNIHNAPVKGNFCNEGGKAIKPQTVMDYIHHMGYVDRSGRMGNSYSTDWHKLKWIKKLFFHLLALDILKSCNPHSNCGVRKFHIGVFDLPCEDHFGTWWTITKNTKATRQIT